MPKTMDELLSGSKTVEPLENEQIISAKVIEIKGKKLSLDLGPYGLGLVPKRELGLGKSFEVGQEVEADRGWKTVEDAFKDGTKIEVIPVDCNKGGLLIELEGAKGFLPVSQLSSKNYPKLSGNQDKSAIADSIKSLIGKPMEVKVIALDRSDNKLIFSEKDGRGKTDEVELSDFEIGQTVAAKVTGIVEYGAFVSTEGAEGMIHISELSWKRVGSPEDVVSVGDGRRKFLALRLETKLKLR